MRIYLDCCCFNRPFDDLRQDRNRIEADAITTILGRVGDGRWELVGSEVLEFELSRMSDHDRLESCMAMLRSAAQSVPADSAVKADADSLLAQGFGPLDAAHLASARRAKVDVFLTVDDKLLRKARALEKELGVLVESPVVWLLEQSKGDGP